MATIKDVAREAGVAVATVSRVINSNGYVSLDTKKKVEEAMKKLGFLPSNVARGLVSKKTYTLGLIVPDITNPFFPDIARGVEDEAIENNYSLILCNSDWKVEREKMYISLLREKWCEGVILAGSRMEERELQSAIAKTPIVSIDRETKQVGHSVWVDNRLAAFEAVEHLYERGYQKVAYISGPPNSRSSADRAEGYQQAVEKAGLHSEQIVESNYRVKGGEDAMIHLLSLPKKEQPDAVFAGNDLMATGALRALSNFGMEAGKDFGVIGFDGIAVGGHVPPTLSTILQPAYEMGRRACQLLIQEIESPSKRLIREVFRHELLFRDTTKR